MCGGGGINHSIGAQFSCCSLSHRPLSLSLSLCLILVGEYCCTTVVAIGGSQRLVSQPTSPPASRLKAGNRYNSYALARMHRAGRASSTVCGGVRRASSPQPEIQTSSQISTNKIILGCYGLLVWGT